MAQHTNYTPPCKYSYDKLENIIYLVEENASKVYIDNGEAYIDNLSGTPLVLHSHNINFTEESSLDERYKFQKQLTFTVYGYANRNTLEGKYYAIVQSKDGTKWMVNVDFPSIVTYDFRLNATEYQTVFTLNTLSNFPTLRLASSLPQGINVCKQLNVSSIDSLQLIENDLAKLDKANKRLYISSDASLIDVDFLGNSCSLQEQFDGQKVTTTIDFNIAFDSYKSSWHYNLLEFANNHYCALIKPKNNDNTFFCGFNFGLEPSYKVTATTTNNGSDIVTVTLTETSIYGSTAENGYEEQEDTSKRWRYVNSVSGTDAYQCVGNGIGMYLLKQEVDSYGIPTGNYKAYTGTSSQFPTLNIVGEFTEQKTYSEPRCNDSGCRITEDFPNAITFNAITCNTYTFSSTCNWRIVNVPSWLSISPISGLGSTSSIVQVCSTIAPPSGGLSGTFGIRFGSDLLPSRIVTVNLIQEGGIVSPNPQDINCLKQNVIFRYNSNCAVQLVGQPPQGVTVLFSSGQMTVNVPANTSTASTKQYILGIKNCNNTYENVYINQDKTYERWVDTSDYICESGSSYVKQQRYTGTTLSNTNTPTSEYRKGSLIASGDTRCGSSTRWRWDNNYYCVDGNKFKAEEEEVSTDGGTTWTKDGNTRIGEMVESASSFCEETVEYKWELTTKSQCEECGITTRTVSGAPYCDGYDKKVIVEDQFSVDCGEYWTTSSRTEVLVEADSEDCGYVPPYSAQYLTFKATESGTFKFSRNSVNYSLDSGSTWTSLASGTSSPTVASGQKIMWKAELTPATYDGIGKFSSTNSFTVEGNAMSLLYGDNFSGQTSLSGKNYAFSYLFSGCTNLTSAENLSLLATTLADYCYYRMFIGCTSLTTAPELPATTLATSCYQNMFRGCTSLTKAPVLSATTLANHCYEGMFNGCTSLTTALVLSATTLANYCYSYMFQGCTSLTTAPSLPATTLAASCYSNMFSGCTSLTTAPELPATTLVNRCYSYMFSGCTSLNYIKCLATDISATYCTYRWVDNVAANGTFVRDCGTSWTEGVNGIPSGWTDNCSLPPYSAQYLTFKATESGTFSFTNPINYSLDNGSTWTELASGTSSPTVSAGQKIMWKAELTPATYYGPGRFSSTNSFTAEGNIMSLLYGDNFKGQTSLSGKNNAFSYLFKNCSGLTSTENLSLPATTLGWGCYSFMFHNCTNLTTAPSLPAITLKPFCYSYMFESCTSLTTAPVLNATTLADYCYYFMFQGCTSLTTAPQLLATTLAEDCYSNMFKGCTSLTTAPELLATTLASCCYEGMFIGCTSLTTAPVLSATTLADYCYYWMFKGCSSLNNIWCLAEDKSASNCTDNWVEGVAASGTFTKSVRMSSWGSGINGIPSGWTVQDA